MSQLNPSQFGFIEGDKSTWEGALDKFSEDGGVRGRISPNAELHTGQQSMSQFQVDHYTERKAMRSHTPVEIYHHEGKMWLGEGHHRIAAARAKGQKSIGVVHYGRE